QFCDGSETCHATLDCRAGTAVPVDDGVGCTVDSCDEVGDVVVNAVNNANCDNGQFCDGSETCHATLDCQAGTTVPVDDSVACTDDSCDEVGDLVVNTVDDALCDDGDPCTVGICDAVSGCASVPVSGCGASVPSSPRGARLLIVLFLAAAALRELRRARRSASV
ncbi:MAG: hypothetical protein VX681_03565, partial [Myxococcota bacterium]|nr:hypothetical protein [Myxococcota bacterium]